MSKNRLHVLSCNAWEQMQSPPRVKQLHKKHITYRKSTESVLVCQLNVGPNCCLFIFLSLALWTGDKSLKETRACMSDNVCVTLWHRKTHTKPKQRHADIRRLNSASWSSEKENVWFHVLLLKNSCNASCVYVREGRSWLWENMLTSWQDKRLLKNILNLLMVTHVPKQEETGHEWPWLPG